MSGPYATSLWLQMAAKARTVAGDLQDPELKREMLRIAEGYDTMAERTAVLIAHETDNQQSD
jgi:hypothetical protein